MARTRKVVFECEESFARVAARVVAVRSEEVFEQAKGVLDLDDIERVHDMRVATRRLRAALEIFAPAFPRKRYRKALKRVRALADALGARRDPDVEIELLEGLTGEIAEDDRAELTVLLNALRTAQRQANEELAPFVAAKRLKKLRRLLARLVEGVGE